MDYDNGSISFPVWNLIQISYIAFTALKIYILWKNFRLMQLLSKAMSHFMRKYCFEKSIPNIPLFLFENIWKTSVKKKNIYQSYSVHYLRRSSYKYRQ